MRVTPLRSPLDGEQVVAVDPPLAPRVDAGWRRRLHLFTGRSLDASALTAEQRSRAARAALLAQALTPGIVAGLEASLEGADHASAVLDVAPGLGITAWGEDVRLPRALRVPLGRIQVVAPDGGGTGLTLGERVDGGFLPPALVLILQPVLVEEIGAADPLDPCERDPQSEAFEDQRTVDGCRPLLVSWPEGPEWSLPAVGPRWRNQLAWAVFDQALRGPGALPWEALGLPLGLIGNDRARRALFLDRATVARIGGRPRARTGLLPEAGDPGLWRARIQQFAEHLADLFAAPTTLGKAAARFERLPPAGLLPVEVARFARPVEGEADQDGGAQLFFPRHFHVGAAPIPLDELEPVFEASASLAPLDFAKAEEVQLLVPVPGALYEPELLVRERVDPEFETTLAEFRADRDRWLGRREAVRTKARILTRDLGGAEAPLPFPEDDPDRQADEAPLDPDPPEEAFGTMEVSGRPRALNALAREFSEGRFKTIQKEWDQALLNREGLDGIVRVLANKVSGANDKIDLAFLHLQTEIYRVRQILLGNVAGTRLATSPVLAEIAQGESARATRENISQFFFDTAKPGKAPLPSRAAEARFAAEAPAAKKTALAMARPDAEGLSQEVAPTRKKETAGTRVVYGKTEAMAEERLGRYGPAAKRKTVEPDDIREQSPLTGATLDFRDLSVAERLGVPPAKQAEDFALANLLQIFNGLEDLGLVVDDLQVPLYGTDDVTTKDPATQKDVEVKVRVRRDEPYKAVKGRLAARILDQPRSVDADESNILSNAVSFQETASVFLRRLEARVQLYQAALDACHEAAGTIGELLTAARQRLATLDRELAEARHDVSVALALLAEETERIEGINNRRLEILTHHVPFLAYHRPRVAETLADTPVRSLDPGLSEDPVPAALARPADPPADLREMVELLRDAPLRWFRHLPKLLDKLDRLDVLLNTLRLARGRAEAVLARPVLQITTVSLAVSAAEGTGRTLAAQRQRMTQSRAETARLDLAALERQSWKAAAELAKRILSLGDLLDIPHGRAEVVRLGARELDQILRVSTALWAGFAEVLPALRLDWVERLSQFDTPFDLRRLSSLPRWEEIEVLDRRALQALVDWLFQRIDTREPEAVELINDLVRVSLLLASHAPVDLIVAGHVAEDTPLRPGGTVRLVVELARVRIGMQALFFSQEKTVARGIVEDLGDGRATARVLQTFAAQVSVTANSRVEFTDALQEKTRK